jgi:two-component system, cell cycle sensor histidine kinase and response regulator CckA
VSVNLHFSRKNENPIVLADELLDEVFTNLLSNSVLHGKRNHVQIEIKIEDLQGEKVAGQDKENYSYWKITFVDNGQGIPDDLKEKLFTRYMGKSSGSGLGLSIVHALVVDRYSGRVNLRNTEERDHTKGTTMEVILLQAAA